jgi:hypothetical protein
MKTILLLCIAVLMLGVSVNTFAAMPAEQCYEMATNKDRALENRGMDLQASSTRTNPCTGQSDTVNVYYDLKGGVTHIRTVYGNGDVEGYHGLSYYRACHSSGKAMVSHRIYGAGSGRGIGWGFWFNFPFDDDPSTWRKDRETCNTL